jgi:hypothetical protein
MKPGSKQMTDWLRALLQRKPRKLAAVALANKIARTAWAMMKSGETHRRQSTRQRRRRHDHVSSRNAKERNGASPIDR